MLGVLVIHQIMAIPWKFEYDLLTLTFILFFPSIIGLKIILFEYHE